MNVLPNPVENDRLIIDNLLFEKPKRSKEYLEHLCQTVRPLLNINSYLNGKVRLDWKLFAQLDIKKHNSACQLLVSLGVLSITRSKSYEVVSRTGETLMPVVDGLPTFFPIEKGRANLFFYCNAYDTVARAKFYHYRIRTWNSEGTLFEDSFV